MDYIDTWDNKTRFRQDEGTNDDLRVYELILQENRYWDE